VLSRVLHPYKLYTGASDKGMVVRHTLERWVLCLPVICHLWTTNGVAVSFIAGLDLSVFSDGSSCQEAKKAA
jgi:hypothetical protein